MGEVIGVVQLINKKRDPARPARGPTSQRHSLRHRVRGAGPGLGGAGRRLAGKGAAVRRDPQPVRRVRGRVGAGHRIAGSDDVRALAAGRDAVDRAGQAGRRHLATGRWRPSGSTTTQLQQIEYAAVLHDFGKVGVRERVLVKARKLYDEDRRAIQLRFAYIKKALQVEHAERKLRVALELAQGRHPAPAGRDRRRAGAQAGRARRRLGVRQPRQRADRAGSGRLRAAGRDRAHDLPGQRRRAAAVPGTATRSRRCRSGAAA